MQLALDDPSTDFLFGLTSNGRLKKRAEPYLEHTRRLHETRPYNAHLVGQQPPHRSRTFHELDYLAHSCPQAFRTVLKAEVMGLGDIPRFVVTSLEDPSPEILYTELHCARGQDENFIKMIKNDLARAQPSTVIVKLFKPAVRVCNTKTRQAPPAQQLLGQGLLLHTITEGYIVCLGHRHR